MEDKGKMVLTIKAYLHQLQNCMAFLSITSPRIGIRKLVLSNMFTIVHIYDSERSTVQGIACTSTCFFLYLPRREAWALTFTNV
jgi:hypothetical protein